MVNTVIVALPAVDNKVYKISSEKVPHLTLAFLSDNIPGEDLATIVTYVQHAARQLSPFGLQVDYRGELGPDQADVLFFEKKYEFERIADFRHYLLLDDTLRRAYDSVDQYPEWTPHLTLGYPESPAKEDDADYPGIYYVQFDRIAVWIGDFEGPEFRLKYEETGMDQVMAMSEGDRGVLVAANLFGDGPELAHYGVKGMKWGVTTKDNAPKVTQTREKKALRNAKDVTVSQRKAGTYVTTKGGQRQKAAEDAVRAQAGRQKAKKSTTDALSNKELKDTIERMRLEQEYKKLDAKVSRRGEGFLKKLFQAPDPATIKAAENLAKKAG